MEENQKIKQLETELQEMKKEYENLFKVDKQAEQNKAHLEALEKNTFALLKVSLFITKTEI